MIKKVLFILVCLMTVDTVVGAFSHLRSSAVIETVEFVNGQRIVRRLNPPLTDKQCLERYERIRVECASSFGSIRDLDEQKLAAFFEAVDSLRYCGAYMGSLKHKLIPDYFELRAKAIIEEKSLDRSNLSQRIAYIKRYYDSMMSLSVDINLQIPQLVPDAPETKYIIESMKPGLDEHVRVLYLELFTSMMSNIFANPAELMRELSGQQRPGQGANQGANQGHNSAESTQKQ